VLRLVGLGTTLLRAQKELFGITMSSDLELSDIALDPRHQKGEADLRAEPAASGAAETSLEKMSSGLERNDISEGSATGSDKNAHP